MSAPLKDKDCIIAIFDSYAKTVMRNECRDAVDQEKRKRKKEQVGTEKMQYLFETQVHEDMAKQEQQQQISIEDVRAVLAAKSQDGKTREVKALLMKYDAGKLSGVKPEDYPMLLKEAEAL